MLDMLDTIRWRGLIVGTVTVILDALPKVAHSKDSWAAYCCY
jgi:hypothetical protein